MVSEWHNYKIGELGKVVTGKTPSTKKPEYFMGRYPFIAIPDMGSSVFVSETARSLSEAGAEVMKSCHLPKDSVMMSCIATIGKCGITTKDSFTNQQINSVICDQEKVYPLYLYYVFTQLRGALDAVGGGGSVYTNVSKSRFSSIPLSVPPIAEQRAIAHILGSLDDKIELNRRMNETLESMARAIFKSWFVDFDPVRAKAEGRDPGLPSGIAVLFPDSFQDSELGGIPMGWEVKTIGEVVEFAYGKALKASNRKLGNIPVFGSNGPVGLHNEALVKGPGIVIGRKGNPGIVTWSSKDFFPIDTTFYAKQTGIFSSLNYLFYALESQDLPALSADSAVPGLNRNLAYMSNILVPSEKVLTAFDEQIDPLFQKINANDNEEATLASLRDTLLPKLISGELRVPDAEKFVEEAGL